MRGIRGRRPIVREDEGKACAVSLLLVGLCRKTLRFELTVSAAVGLYGTYSSE
jgi:hypothetical protein